MARKVSYFAVVALLLFGCSRLEDRQQEPVSEPPRVEFGTTGAAEHATAPGDSTAAVQLRQSRIWALDTSNQNSPELLFAEDKPFLVAGTSPDCRYLLLIQRLAKYKGDLTAIPYVWDRTTDKLSEGNPTSIRFARWSGQGFYVDWLSHLDLTLQEQHFDQLASRLNLVEGERTVVGFSFSADGMRFAALVGHPSNVGTLDLVWGTTDGLNIAVTSIGETEGEAAADVAIAPNGKYVAVQSKSKSAIVRIGTTAPGQWTTIPLAKGSGYITWAPNSNHVWFPNAGVFNLSGERKVNPGSVHGLVWSQDGESGLVYGWSQEPFLHSFKMDGTTSAQKLPEYMIPAGYLPDGRVLVWRTITE